MILPAYNPLSPKSVITRLSFLGISYDDFVRNTHESLEKIVDYCNINHLETNLEKAIAFVRKPVSNLNVKEIEQNV
jgi:hypothetical protein